MWWLQFITRRPHWRRSFILANSSPFDNSRPTILCGYGALGKEIARNAQAVGVYVRCVFDNHYDIPSEDVPEGICVTDLGIDLEREPIPEFWEFFHSANFVICAIRHQARTELRQQLEALGAKHIYHATDLLRAYPNLVALARPGTWEDRTAVFDARTLWQDGRSCLVQGAITRSWTEPVFQLDDEDPNLIDDIADIYFPDFIKPLPHEVFVDVGAFDGDTVRSFIAHRDGVFSNIVAFEPDQNNFGRLQKYATLVRDEYGPESMFTVCAALSDHCGQVSFAAESNQGSHTGDGSDSVPCGTLDTSIGNLIPTWIKADIEGSELTMLEGARETIRRFMPVLAVVCYHNPRDLWELPRFIHEIAPGYKLLLRKYAPDFYESVLYAVPSDRIIWDKV